MSGIPSMLLAGLTGGFFGLISAVPVGPVNLAVMNEGARHGFPRAAWISLGAVCMETVYCFAAFTGFVSFLTQPVIQTGLEWFTLVFLVVFGVRFLRAKPTDLAAPMGAGVNRLEARIEQRLHPSSAFTLGVVAVLGNLGVLLFWIVLAAQFISREWVTPDWRGKLACVAGVALGMSCWFFSLSYAASRGRGRISERTLLRLEHGSGFALLGLALIHGVHLFWQLATRPG